MPAHMMATTTRGGGDDSTSADHQKQKTFAFMDEKYYSTDMALKNDPDTTSPQRLYFGRPLIESIALGTISLVMAVTHIL